MKLTFEETYPNFTIAEQLREDNPEWPFGTFRAINDYAVPLHERVYLTEAVATEEEALAKAKAAYDKE